jgi:hypothetical protein
MTDLSYPIGKFIRQATYSSSEIEGFIQTLEQLPKDLRTAVTGLNQTQLDTPYRPDGWTVRQLVHHIADSHMNAYVRIKLTLTEDNLTIKPYKEKDWANLADSSLDTEISLILLEALHTRWTTMLRNCTPTDWQRTYTHPASGVWTLEPGVALYAWHSKHHLEHILALRTRQNW